MRTQDKSGTSDPYARVRVGGRVVFKTKTVKKSLQPEWNESFTTKISDGKSLLDIKVKDKNTLSDVDIGDCTLDVADLLQSGQTFDGWLALEPSGNGEVHVRVEVSSEDNMFGNDSVVEHFYSYPYACTDASKVYDLSFPSSGSSLYLL
ncbi:C2 domain-containing protein [Fennellomyces sp. T-0311]|nr:C2 domain-containing protein [Fennellomyces sp. T-0311]